MDDLLRAIGGSGQGQTGQGGGPLGELLGNVMGSGGLGSMLGGPAGGASLGGSTMSSGGLAAMIPSVLPALLGLLGGQGGGNQTGLHQLVGTMQANGLGSVARSWIGNGASQAISPSQVEQVLSPSQLSELAAKSGLPADQLKTALASLLPHVVSGLSPNGSLPQPAQVQGLVGELQQALGSLGGLSGGTK